MTESSNLPSSPEPMQLPREQVLRNRWKLIGILLVFVLPVFFAYAGYFGGWFQDYARSNRGELLQPVPQISAWQWQQADGQDFATGGKWWLVYVHGAAACDAACELALYTLRQTWIGIGKENDRVRAGVIASLGSVALPEHTVALRAATLPVAPAYYIIDPLGNVVLRYAAPASQQDAIERSKDIRKDFQKLLRFSHIG
ncbi:MAG: hypothetical protein ACK4E7_14225 [Permianibacter sp.]